MPLVKKTHCKYGHEIAVVGRDKSGACKACKVAFDASPKGKETKAIYYLNNKERIYIYSSTSKRKAAISAYNMTSVRRDKKRISSAKWKSLPESRIKINVGTRKRYNTDTQFKIAAVLISRLLSALKGKYKDGSAVRDLGCSVSELLDYFKVLFYEGMSWENHGLWHIDHVIPLTAFDLTDPEQLKKACHFTNLQPLWGVDNIRKGGVKKYVK